MDASPCKILIWTKAKFVISKWNDPQKAELRFKFRNLEAAEQSARVLVFKFLLI